MKRGIKNEMTILMWNETCKICYKNGPTPASFLFIIGLFKQTIQFLQQINVKNFPNVHLVYGNGIQTHNLSNMSHHP